MSHSRAICPNCNGIFALETIHSGFNDSEFLYCDHCHRVAVLNVYSKKSGLLISLGKKVLWGWRTSPEDSRKIEEALEPCFCGSRFTFAAKPKCPKCLHDLKSPLTVLGEDSNSRKQWGPKGWESLYCLIIENGAIEDPFKK